MDSNLLQMHLATVPVIDDILRDGASRALQSAIEREVDGYIERNYQQVDSGGQPNVWPVNPRKRSTTNRRAACGKPARPVRREGRPGSIGLPYPDLRPTGAVLSGDGYSDCRNSRAVCDVCLRIHLQKYETSRNPHCFATVATLSGV